ncbi:protein SFI1 homolog [Diprion similis]|uniref:protein SFI1 homolog n=1 Tax=Diprion similis TaxID=362088 RepID=UPI001EF98473|nr:protein SFI1 homolog [Diprion similis]
MTTIIYCAPEKYVTTCGGRKLKPKLPKYLIKRKILTIREKIIARKYGHIYLRKVFGKYHPSECRRYYNMKVLRRFFEKLKAHWFEVKQVHRLIHKADVFYEGKLMRKTFSEWLSYAARIKIIKKQENIVRWNYDERLLKTAVYRWKTITEKRKNFKIMRQNAIELFYSTYTLLLLLKLSEYFHEQIKQSLLEMKSILIGRSIFMRKCIRRWRSYVFQQKNERSLRSKAVSYYIHKVSGLYFARWRKYVCYKRTKREIVQICVGLYEDTLLKMVVKFWKNETTLQVIERQRMMAAAKFHDDLLKRKLLKTWIRYVRHKLQGRTLKHKANFFYTMRLKQKILDALSKNVTCCKNTKLAIQKLKLFYKRLLILNVWNKWTIMIDEKNDSELRDKILVAKSFYQQHIIEKCLKKWIKYKIFQQKIKSLNSKVLDLCRTFYCKQFFNTWKKAYSKKRRIVLLEEKATQFFKDSLLQNAISRWIKSYNDRISMKVKYRISGVHYDKKIVGKCFAAWINFCNENIRVQNLLNEADEYYLEMLQRKILKKLLLNIYRKKVKREEIEMVNNFYKKTLVNRVFENWWEHCVRVKELNKKVEEYNQRAQNKLKLKLISQWKLYVNHKKCSFNKTSMSRTYYHKKICLKTFDNFKYYVNYRRKKKIQLSYLEDRVGKIEFIVKTIYFQHWRVARLLLLKEKCKMFHADEFHQSHLKRKFFCLWKKFLWNHQTKRQHQTKVNNIINVFILKRCLKIWYTRYKTLMKNHLNQRWVDKIYEMKISYKYFIAWKYYTEVRLTEKQEIYNAREYYKKLIIKQGLQHLIKLFLSNTELRYEIHLNNVAMNSVHEFELLRKYFNKWQKTVFCKTQTKSQIIRGQNDLESYTPILRSKHNDDIYACNFIPRFVIPDFMKDEIKLRFGIGHSSDRIPVIVSKVEVPRGQTPKTEYFVKDAKLNKKMSSSRLNDNNQGHKYSSCQLTPNQFELKSKSGNDQKFSTNSLMKFRKLRLNADEVSVRKLTSSNKISFSLSPDGSKSDSDSVKTYLIQNPTYFRNLCDEISFEVKPQDEDCNKENKFKLLPPSAFYVAK